MRILFIDDEQRRMEIYVEELAERGHEVIFKSDVDSAMETLRNDTEHFDLVILDISMAPGRTFEIENTFGGARTGLALYAKIRELRPGLKVMVLTNVVDRRVGDQLLSQEDPAFCDLVRKPDTLPFQFAERVGEFLSGTEADEESQ